MASLWPNFSQISPSFRKIWPTGTVYGSGPCQLCCASLFILCLTSDPTTVQFLHVIVTWHYHQLVAGASIKESQKSDEVSLFRSTNREVEGNTKEGRLMCILGKASFSALLTFLNLFWFSSERETIIIEAVHVRKTLSGCCVKLPVHCETFTSCTYI